jgi:N4-gp56 family major capsid protein
MAAIAQCICMQFVNTEAGYGKKKGESVTITRVSNVTVPTSDILDERTRISEDSIALSTQAVAVYERGRAIPYTSLSLDLAHFDLENAIQKNLRDQLKLSMDGAAATAFKSGKVKAIPTGASTIVFDTDGTASTTATANLNLYHVEQIRDYMFSTLLINPMSDGNYACMISTKGKRGVMADTRWEDWHKYISNEKKYNSELGKMEQVRFVESNNTSAFSASLGSGGVLGEAVFFGDDAVTMGVVMEPELRAKESEDYGRSKGVAWYGIYGFEQIWDDSASAGEARVVHVTSA